MNIDDLTIKDARELAALLGGNVNCCQSPAPYVLNAKYFIRTVTHHHTGILVAVHEHELVLEHAAWIADDGRLTDSLAKGEFNEVEMFPDGSQVIIGRASIIDAVQIPKIPTSQK